MMVPAEIQQTKEYQEESSKVAGRHRLSHESRLVIHAALTRKALARSNDSDQ